MKLTTIALAIAFALPTTFALAGPMNLASPVVVHSEASQSARHALCVPKTLSALMRRRNHLSWRNDQAAVFRPNCPGVAIQVEEPA
jgi:hypothetical protein